MDPYLTIGAMQKREKQYRDALREAVDAIRANRDGRFDHLTVSEAVEKIEEIGRAAIYKIESVLKETP